VLGPRFSGAVDNPWPLFFSLFLGWFQCQRRFSDGGSLDGVLAVWWLEGLLTDFSIAAGIIAAGVRRSEVARLFFDRLAFFPRSLSSVCFLS